MFEQVKAYIADYILHSASFDAVDATVQRKAVNNAEKVLYSIYSSYKPETKPLPVEAIAYQAIYLLAKDDSDLRVDKGATYVGFNGVALTYAQKNRQVSPDVIRILGRRTGRYALSEVDTNRGVYR